MANKLAMTVISEVKANRTRMIWILETPLANMMPIVRVVWRMIWLMNKPTKTMMMT